jgi:predicted nucleic acid-binding Zn ribbon protein
MARRAPRPIAAALPGLVDRIAPRTPLAAVQLAWSRAVGEAIAAEAAPVSEREGVVTVACRSAAWAEQLDLLQSELLERLRAELNGRSKVAGLRFRVGAE